MYQLFTVFSRVPVGCTDWPQVSTMRWGLGHVKSVRWKTKKWRIVVDVIDCYSNSGFANKVTIWYRHYTRDVRRVGGFVKVVLNR